MREAAATLDSVADRRAGDRLLAELRVRALKLGLLPPRVCEPALPAEVGQRLRAFLEAGMQGEMDWLARDPEIRSDPSRLWPQARSALLTGISYAPPGDPLPELALRDRGYISVYARNRDYHEVLKGRLKELAGLLAARTGEAVKVFVDTAPLMEKPLAQRAGLGWQGKHTNLVSRSHGSWLFLGAILTTALLPRDPGEPDHCGRCRRCLEVCPTGAFPAPYRLDARRCISYLTIEHAGPIPRPLRPLLGNRIYGCDDCLAVCPWNKFAAAARELAFAPRPELVAPSLAELAGLDEPAFRRLFSGSPIKRIGRERFVRNVLVAIGNSGEPGLLPVVEERLVDASPLVRGAAVWALSRLAAPARFAALRAVHEPAETDPSVREEWAAAHK
ncbi:MAG: tRNA epoxyqueuosine(34) reductase QueG [Geminicoccaceae bacterium]|nr:tRNA epoxyqueuosine(34) reductase QueG [Geminicoccaceae bacterium]